MRTRNEFSSPTKRDALKRAHGICECHLIPHVFMHPCGLPLGDGNTFYEHIDPERNSGRNDLGNCACLTRNCWRFKTDRYDKPVVAKAGRQFDRAHGIKPRYRQRLPGGRDSGIRLKIGGGVVDRATGLPR